jgi:hypothetical protein
MTRKANKPPTLNKLLDSEYVALSTEPLVGMLLLDTDQGPVELAINKDKAEFLLSALFEFLGEGTGEDAPKFNVSTSH